MNEDFINYMLQQENGALLAGDTSKLLHDSPEGGTKTFGFGHKLTAEEQRTGKIKGKPIKQMTRDDAIALFREDLAKAAERAKVKLANGVKSDKYGVAKADWNQLSERQKAMLTDFEFNVKDGIKKFPAFTYGVITNNQDIMRQEYERSFTNAKGRTLPLGPRNRAFADLFFAPAIQAADDPEAQFMLDIAPDLKKPTNDLFVNPLLQGSGLVSAEDPEAQTFMDTATHTPMQRSLKPLQNIQPYDNRVTEVNVPVKMTGSPPITSFMGTPLPQAPTPTPAPAPAPVEEPKNIWRDGEGRPIRDRFGGYIYSGNY